MRIHGPQDLLMTLSANAAASDGNNVGNYDSNVERRRDLFAQLLQDIPTITAPPTVDGDADRAITDATNAQIATVVASTAVDPAMAVERPIDLPVVLSLDTSLDPSLGLSMEPETPVAADVALPADAGAVTVEPEAAVDTAVTTATSATAATRSKPVAAPAVTPVLSPAFIAPSKPATVAAKTATTAAEPLQAADTNTASVTDTSAAADTTESNTTAAADTAGNDTVATPASVATSAEPPAVAASTANIPMAVAAGPHTQMTAAAGNQRPSQKLPTTTPDRTTSTTSRAAHSHNRGALLPPGGNELPSAATATLTKTAAALTAAETTAMTLTPAFDVPVAAKPAPVVIDTAAAQSQWSQQPNLAAITPGDAARNAGFADQSLLPPLLTSTFIMGSAAWGEETAQQLRWLNDDEQQSAQLQLHPAELGRLDITIDIKDGQASVQLVAGNAEARELLEKSLPALRELLTQQGMTLADGQVSQNSGQRAGNPGNFQSSMPFVFDDELPLAELPLQPAYRAAGNNHRIDYYV